MKKTLLFVLSLFFVLCTITCDTDIGLGGNKGDAPVNLFTGGEWESILKNSDNDVYQTFRISFTDTGFIFHMWFKNNYDYTYTGTYKLLPDDKSKPNMHLIEFFSVEPTMNGILLYTFDITYLDENNKPQKYPEGTVYFTADSNNDIPIGGIYKKTN